jgi:hypothetical protein
VIWCPKKAIAINTTSAKTAPTSTIKAAREPLLILVSSKTKKTGPVAIAKRKEKGMAVKTSVI